MYKLEAHKTLQALTPRLLGFEFLNEFLIFKCLNRKGEDLQMKFGLKVAIYIYLCNEMSVDCTKGARYCI